MGFGVLGFGVEGLGNRVHAGIRKLEKLPSTGALSMHLLALTGWGMKEY